MKRILSLTLFTVLLATVVMSVASCGKPTIYDAPAYDDPAPDGVKHTVVIEVKKYGDITVELYEKYAPVTVANFLKLVNEGFYDGLTFHRVISGFMIQGGDPRGDGTGGSDTDIKGEFLLNGHLNPLKHERGVISMARSNDPDSASSQFFIVHKDSFDLDDQYAAFGRVRTGMDTVDKIAALKTDDNDKPLKTVTIKRIYVIDNID